MAKPRSSSYVEIQCQQCGAPRKYPRKTYLEYLRRGCAMLCAECAIKNQGAHNLIKIEGTCSRCGCSYTTGKDAYTYKERHGKPHYCKECAREIIATANRERNLARWQRFREEKALTTETVAGWKAPCSMTIIPAAEGPRARCKPGREARCPLDDYDACLTHAVSAGWDGWMVATQ